MKYNKSLALSLVWYCVAALGVSLTIKATVGVSAFNGMIVAFSTISAIKVGTITTLINFGFLLAYAVATKFKYIYKYLLQGIFISIFGLIVNFYLYQLLVPLEITSYPLRLLMMSCGTMIGGFSVGMIIHFNVITFPVESFCVAMEDLTSKAFKFYRYGVDVIALVISISLSLLFDMEFFIREGTFISLILLTTAMNFSKERMKTLELAKTPSPQ